MTDCEYKKKQILIKKLKSEVRMIEKQIEDSDYDEPVECLECDWKGRNSELILFPSWEKEVNQEYVCPRCNSCGYE